MLVICWDLRAIDHGGVYFKDKSPLVSLNDSSDSKTLNSHSHLERTIVYFCLLCQRLGVYRCMILSLGFLFCSINLYFCPSLNSFFISVLSNLDFLIPIFSSEVSSNFNNLLLLFVHYYSEFSFDMRKGLLSLLLWTLVALFLLFFVNLATMVTLSVSTIL